MCSQDPWLSTVVSNCDWSCLLSVSGLFVHIVCVFVCLCVQYVRVSNIVSVYCWRVSFTCGNVCDRSVHWIVHTTCLQAMSSVCDRSVEFASKLRKSASLDGMLSADQDAAVLN